MKIDGTYFVLNMKFTDNRNTNNVTTDEFFLKRGDLSMGGRGGCGYCNRDCKLYGQWGEGEAVVTVIEIVSYMVNGGKGRLWLL